MNCENCGHEHDGSYGSGRFCSEKCSRGFSTKKNRKKISKKVSQKLKGRNVGGGWGNVPLELKSLGGINSAQNKLQRRIDDFASLSWDELSKKYSIKLLRQQIIKEQDGKCNKCHLNEWMGQLLILQLHHKDGNHKNKKRENLECLCPNCHSLTDNWCMKNKTPWNKITAP